MAGNLFFLLSFIESATGETLASFAATYWLHSTLLLGTAWLLIRATRPESHFVRERIWKFAAVAGLATAGIQLATGLGLSLLTDSEAESSDPTPTITVIEEPRPKLADSEMTVEEARRNLTTSLQMVQDSLQKLGDVPATLAESKSEPAAETTAEPARTPADSKSRSTLTQVTFLPIDDAVTPASDEENAMVLVPMISSEIISEESPALVASGEVFSWARAAGILAAGWFALSLLFLAWQSLRFRWQMRHVSEAAPSHRRLLESIRESRGVRRRVRLLKSDRFEEPVAYGLFRSTILIPAQVEKRLNRDELAALLSHELAHLTRGDIVWLVIGRVLTTCFAFQPLNFLARRRWQEHAEFQCDDWAVDRNVDRLTLARSLTLVAEWRAGRKSCAGVVSASGTRFHISDRVERLVADAVPDLWRGGLRRLAIHAAAVIAAGAVIAFGPQTGSAERPGVDDGTEQSEPETPTESELDEPPEKANSAEEENGEAVPEVSKELLSELIREVDGLGGDVSELLAEIRTLEPLLARLEKQPDLADRVAQLRTRIGLLRKLAEARARSATEKTAVRDHKSSGENEDSRGLR